MPEVGIGVGSGAALPPTAALAAAAESFGEISIV